MNVDPGPYLTLALAALEERQQTHRKRSVPAGRAGGKRGADEGRAV